MATTTPNIAAQWKALNPDQRKLAMSKMTGEQKTKLATALGFKGDQTQKTTMADILNPRDPSAVEKPGPNPMDPREAVNAFENIGAGLLTPIVHPVETAKGAFRMSPLGMALDLKNGRETAPEEMAKQFVDNPYGTIESGIGMAAVLGGAEEAAGAVPGTAGNVARMLTKTGPKETEELVKETKAGNEAATAKAAEETAKQNAKHAEDVAKAADKRKVDLREHFEKTQDTKAANAAKEAPVARREALDRGVERLDTEARGDLKNLEKKVHDAADQRYKDLRATLADEEADPYQPANEEGRAIGEPVTMVEHLYDVASTPLRGTETETPIIKSLAKRTEQGDVGLTYNDLQGYREEVGRELRKGTLPPDVYTSYKGLMGAIDDAMEGIAKRHGLLDQQKAARAGWRQYADTFLDRDSPFRKWKTAADSPNYKPGMGVSYIRNADTGIQAIAKYDPELAARLNNLRNSAAEAKALPAKPGKLGSLPKLAPKEPTPEAPSPVRPELKTISPEDVRAKKLNSLQEKGVPRVRKVGHRIVNYGIGLHALWDAFSGRMTDLPRDVGLGLAGYGATEAFARLLERRDIQRALSNPTAADLKQIPPELRANIGPMLDAAKAKGVTVSPKWYAAGKRVGSLLRGQ